MKAGVVHAKNDIRFEEIKTPVPEKGQVLVKVKYTGICGSDVPRVNGDACHFFPNVLGHEFSGVVETIGEGVSSLKPVCRWFRAWNVRTAGRGIIPSVNITVLSAPGNSEVSPSMWRCRRKMR